MPTNGWMPTGGPSSRASSTATATWSSAATAPPSSPPGWPGSPDELRANVGRLIAESRRSGTTTNECKSGYGLTVDTELQSLQIAAEFADEITFLGAHLVPSEYADRPDDSVDLVIGTEFTTLTHSDDIDAVLAGLRPDATEPADSALLTKIHSATC